MTQATQATPDMRNVDAIDMQEAARIGGCSVRTIINYRAAGQLTTYRFGPRAIRVDRREVLALFSTVPSTGGSGA